MAMGIPIHCQKTGNLNVHIIEEKVKHFQNFLGHKKEHASSFGIGLVGPTISIYTTILLVEALETFTNLGMSSFISVYGKFE